MRVPAHPITIQKMNEHEQWEDFFCCRASVNNLYGEEYYAARKVGDEQTVVFTCRYCKKLSEVTGSGFRIIFRRKAYDITGVDNMKYHNRIVKLKGVSKYADMLY